MRIALLQIEKHTATAVLSILGKIRKWDFPIFSKTKSHRLWPMAFPSDVENTGFEPVTSCLPGKRSSQLS